VAKMVQEKAH